MTLQYNNGEIQIEEGVTLLNPKMDVIGVHYNIITNTYIIEVEFYENLFRFNRTYDGQGEVGMTFSMANVITFVSTHPLLSQFEAIV